jgi:hypothetical protein
MSYKFWCLLRELEIEEVVHPLIFHQSLKTSKDSTHSEAQLRMHYVEWSVDKVRDKHAM